MLYIHIPFCKKKCIYCDFYSGGNPDWHSYIKALLNELSEREGELKKNLSSIYIGGGTPSLMPPDAFERLIEGIGRILKERFLIDELREFTIEANPEDITPMIVDCWQKCGVNRVSMGVQSMNDDELRLLGRRHDSQKVLYAAEVIKKRIPNFSLDVIYGIPDQSIVSLEQTLKKIININPNHVSAYSLTYEPGTPLSLLRDTKKISQADEETYLAMDSKVQTMLEAAGYHRYEISNYSKPGFEAFHNQGYWEGRAYLGLGPSASSFDGNKIRKTNFSDIKKYLSRFSADYKLHPSPFYMEDILTEEEKRMEKIFLSLRTSKGLNLKEFEKDYGIEETEKIRKLSFEWIKSGHLKIEGERLKLQSKGLFISDFIITQLI